MRTLNYIRGKREEIQVGKLLYFGQVWDGIGDGEGLLEDGCIAVGEDEVKFKVVGKNKNVMDTIIRITDIY